MGQLIVTVQILSLYSELGLYAYLTSLLSPFTTHWWLLVVCLTASQLLLNVCSAVRVAMTMDFGRRGCGLAACALMHLCCVGPLWRYAKLMIAYDKSDQDDLFKLKLLHVCSCSFPLTIFVCGQYITNHAQTETVYWLLACLGYVSTVLTITHFSTDFPKSSSAYKPVIQLICIAWRLFTIFSRVSTLVWVSSSPYFTWIAMALATHLLMTALFFQLRERYAENRRAPFRVWLVLVAVANLIDLTVSGYDVSIVFFTAYYSLILGENIAMVALSYHAQADHRTHVQSLWLVATLASFALGLLLAVMVRSLRGDGDKETWLQRVVNCCCPGTKDRVQTSERGSSYLWDSYDTKNKLLSMKPMYSREQRQQHVDIINNPLGVDPGAVSLDTRSSTLRTKSGSTAKTDPLNSGSHSTEAFEKVSSHRFQVKAEVNDLSPTPDSSSSELQSVNLPPPFFFSATGLRAQRVATISTGSYNIEPLESGSTLPKLKPIEHSSFRLKLKKPTKPCRRLLFLTPSGLQTFADSTANGDRGDGKWVDLNKLYGSLRTFNRTIGPRSPTGPSYNHASRVKEWLSQTGNKPKPADANSPAKEKDLETAL